MKRESTINITSERNMWKNTQKNAATSRPMVLIGPVAACNTKYISVPFVTVAKLMTNNDHRTPIREKKRSAAVNSLGCRMPRSCETMYRQTTERKPISSATGTVRSRSVFQSVGVDFANVK